MIYSEAAPITPIYAPALNWTGGYIGLHGAYGFGNTRDRNNPDADKKDLDGFLGGVQAGYNWQLENNVVLGIEGDVSFGSVKESWIDPSVYSGYYTEDKLTTLGTLRARLGYAAGNFMPYVTGGAAIGHSKHTLGCDNAFATNSAGGNCAASAGDNFHESGSDTRFGYAVGVGAEYAVSSNWTLKAEYLYTDLGKNSVTLTDPKHPTLAERAFDTKISTVRIGFNYRF